MRYKGKGIEEVIPPELKCPELEAATARAKATLPEFIVEVEKGIDGAYVKFPLITTQGLTEHIWAYVHFHREGRFNVSLVNTLTDEKEPSRGRGDVQSMDVEEWQIMSADGSIRGGLHLCGVIRVLDAAGQQPNNPDEGAEGPIEVRVMKRSRPCDEKGGGYFS